MRIGQVGTCAFSIARSNAILGGLSKHDLRSVATRLRGVEVKSGGILHDWDQPLREMYFPTSAVISLFSASSEGGLIETAIVGSEGVVGFPTALTKTNFPFRAVVQVAGRVGRISADAVAGIFLREPDMHRRLNGFMNVLMVQLAQSAICNNRHTVEQRLFGGHVRG